MGILGKNTVAVGTGLFLFLCLPASGVQAAETEYPLVYGSVDQSDTRSVRLYEYSRDYEVLPGDSLWKIAVKLLGDGSRYGEIAENNRDIISNPDLIYPGMKLRTEKECYILNDGKRYQGINTPSGWTVGVMEEGDYWANYTLFSGEGMWIACIEQDRTDITAQTVEDWEGCTQLIRDYADKQYGDAVTDLCFEHYQSEQAEDIYVYSYTYWMDMADYGVETELDIHVCAGLKLAGQSQAQFIGFAYEDGIQEYVRYVTAAYEAQSSGGFYSNMAISPAEGWEADGLFNPFPWIHGFHDAELREALDIPPEGQTAGESLLNRMHGLQRSNAHHN